MSRLACVDLPRARRDETEEENETVEGAKGGPEEWGVASNKITRRGRQASVNSGAAGAELRAVARLSGPGKDSGVRVQGKWCLRMWVRKSKFIDPQQLNVWGLPP